MKPAALWAALLLLAGAATPGAGQQVYVRLGGVHATYANTISGSAATATGRLAWDAPRDMGSIDASYARFSSGWWATQVGGSYYGIRLVGARTGLGLRADGELGRLSDGAWSGTVEAGPVASTLLGPTVLSGGLAAGALRRVDSLGSAFVSATLRASADAGPWSFEAAVTTTHARTIDITDATAQVAFSAGAFDLSALVGGRAGNLGGRPWLQGRAGYRAAPWAALELQGGNYPRDVTGFTGGSYLSFGVWLRPFGRPAQARSRDVLRRAASPVTIESVGPGREQVTFIVPGARQVAIAGEWNDWTPVALTRLDGQRWRTEVPIGKGAHRFSLLLDGGRWYVPAGVPSLPDSFGGTVGLLVVD